jgi:rfaE bifunctional protein nucleotidyltransferase chain/domain
MSKKILVVGDACLDQFCPVRASKLYPGDEAREDPSIRTWEEASEPFFRVGAGANVAVQLAQLGNYVHFYGPAFDDPRQILLEDILGSQKVQYTAFAREDCRLPTKTRIFSERDGSLMAKLNQNLPEGGELGPGDEEELQRAFPDIIDLAAIVICDNGFGFINGAIGVVLRSAAQRGIPVVVDPGPSADWAHYDAATANMRVGRGFSLTMVPSERDALNHVFSYDRFINHIPSEWAEAGAQASAEKLISILHKVYPRVHDWAITRGRMGAFYWPTRVSDWGTPYLDNPPASELGTGAIGAGDVMTALVAHVVARGVGEGQSKLPMENIIQITTRSLARGCEDLAQVRQGLQTCGIDTCFHADFTPDYLAPVVEARARGEGVVAITGCFDILHQGHFAALRFAKEGVVDPALSPHVIVLLNDDVSVRTLKGDDRPIRSCQDRTAALMGLPWVDQVIPFSGRDASYLVEKIKPEYFVKGGDWGDIHKPPEAKVVIDYGGQVLYGPFLEGVSTTKIIEAAKEPVSG